MRKYFKKSFFAIMTIMSLLLAGCQEDQSEFKLESITDLASISGTVYYSTGVDTVGNDYTYDILKPAVGRKVFVEVAYSQYQSGNSNGSKIYETVIDDNGNFTIQIPTKSDGINATLRLEDFTANYTEYLKMEAGKPIFKTSLYRYSKSINLTSLKPGSCNFTDAESIQYDHTSVSLDGYNESVTLKGIINLAIETGFRQGSFVKAPEAAVEFQIDYGETNNNTPVYYNFGTMTDATGNYSITIPAKSLKDGFKIKNIKVLGIGNTAFTHWTSQATSSPLSGAYQLQDIVGSEKTLENIIEGYPYELGDTYLFFSPYYNGNITSPSNPINWRDDLAGWAFGKTEFAGMEGVVTLSGRIETAIETAYGTGAYTKTIQTVEINGIKDNNNNSKKLVLATDAEGNFSVDIPVKDPNTINSEITVSIDNTSAVTYTHYNKKGTEILKDGSYSVYKTIKNPEADWTDLGVIYCKFTPATANTPETWNANLAGWIKIQDYNQTATVTGKLMFPQEIAFATGTYIGAQNEMANITVNYPTGIGNTTFAVPVAEDGSFSVTVPVKDEVTKYTTSFTTKEYQTNTFQHFIKYNSSESQLLSGKYSNDVHAVTKKDANWTDLGTYYYKFTPTTTPTTWHSNLAGWIKIVDSNNILYSNSIAATGNALLAKETAFATGKYEAASGEVVAISAHGKTFQVPIDNSGKFTVTIPLKNPGDKTTLNVSASEITVDNFIHYNKGGSTTGVILDGKYKPGTIIKKIGTAWNELGTIYYKFTPTTTPETWHANLAGWVYKDGYEKSGTISGSIQLPIENSFRNGSYQNGAYQIVTLQCNSFELVGATDANGNFKILVPLQFEDDKPVVTWQANDITTQEAGYFSHYPTIGSNATQLLDGKYSVRKTVNKKTAEWNELGCRYYKFSPTTSTRNWSDNLPGWIVYEADENTQYTVSGSVEKAVEAIDANQRVAAWEADKNRLVTVNIDGTSYDVITRADGSFSFNAKAKELPENLVISITPTDDTSSAMQFTHYKDPNEVNNGETVRGKFKSADNISGEIINKPASGTTYTYTVGDNPVSAKMLFTPDYNLTNWIFYDWNTILNE